MKSSLFLIAIISFAVLVNCGTKEEWKKRTIYQVLTDRFAKDEHTTQSCKDLKHYCGGTYKGLLQNLDYIQGMGFDAIWVSPIVQNLDGGYHGYWATDLYSLNENFGTEQDFKDLISEMHKRGMWMMIDVVANHMGPVGEDFTGINPFNQQEHYHDYCIIRDEDFKNDQWRVENCRLADLPDLKQENPFVKSTLLTWIKDLVKKYKIDGIRIDTIPHMPKDFWKDFQKSAGVYAVGEALDDRRDYVADYQNYLDALLNYPLRYAIYDVWRWGHDFYRLKDEMEQDRKVFKDVDALGVFVDNHDNPRFLNNNGNRRALESATIFGIFAEGIPIVYYGTEQYYGGGGDPKNREQMWTNFDTSSSLYNMLKSAISIRKSHKTWSGKYIERYIDENFLAFSRNHVLIAVTNTQNPGTKNVDYHPFKDGDVVCNIFDGECQTVNGSVQINLDGYLTKVYVKQSSLTDEVTI